MDRGLVSSGDGIPPRLWGRAAGAPLRLLLLDYDGTLAPHRVDRRRARLPRRLSGILEKVASARGTRVAVISGRPVGELERLLDGLPVRLVGDHGWEFKRPGGAVVRHRIPGASGRSLASAAAVLRGETWAGRLERKRASLMLHTRGMSRRRAEAIEARCARLWRRAVAPGSVRLRRVDGGIEIVAAGRDKGTAVRAMIRRCPPGALAVYIGNDVTDEHAFAAVRGRGYGLLVSPRRRPTRALGWIGSVSGTCAFLEEWHLRLDGRDAARDAPGVSGGRDRR